LKLLKGISGGLSLHQPYPISLFFKWLLNLDFEISYTGTFDFWALMMPKTKRLLLNLNRCRWKTNHIILIIYKADAIDFVKILF